MFSFSAVRPYVHVLLLALGLMAINGHSHPAVADERAAAVLAANAEFYRAFRESDIPAMEKVWGEKGTITVVHPGWNPLNGRDAVLESWRRILENPESPKIKFQNAKVEFREGMAMVTCDELLAGGSIKALNIFRLEDGAWKMVFHGAAASASTDT